MNDIIVLIFIYTLTSYLDPLSWQLTLRAQVIRLMLIMWQVIEVVLSHSPAFPSIYLPFGVYELKRCYISYRGLDIYMADQSETVYTDNFESKSHGHFVISKYVILALYRAGARMLSKRCNALSLTFYRRRSRRVMMVLVEAPIN